MPRADDLSIVAIPRMGLWREYRLTSLSLYLLPSALLIVLLKLLLEAPSLALFSPDLLPGSISGSFLAVLDSLLRAVNAIELKFWE